MCQCVVVIRMDLIMRNAGSDLKGVAESYVRPDACLNVRMPLTAEIGQESFTDRRMEFIDVPLHKICVDSSKTKAKRYLSGGRVHFNKECIGNTKLNGIDSHPEHADIKKESVTEDRKRVACDVQSVRASVPGLYSEKEKYTTLRTGGQNTSKQLSEQIRDETKAKSNLSGEGISFNRESVGNTKLGPNDSQPVNTDVQNGSVTEDRKRVACDVTDSGPGLFREKGKYTTTRIIGGQNIRGQLTAQLGNETFIDRMMFFIRDSTPQKIRHGGSVPFEVTTQGDSRDSGHDSICVDSKAKHYLSGGGIPLNRASGLKRNDSQPENTDVQEGSITEDRKRLACDVSVRASVPGLYSEKEKYTTLRTGGQNTSKQLSEQIRDETKAKSNLSGEGISFNRESVGNAGLGPNDSQPVNTDVQNGSVTEDRKRVACDVRASGPGLYRVKGKYTTSKIIAGQNIRQLTARLGDETFIDRMMFFIPFKLPQKIRQGGSVPFEVSAQSNCTNSEHDAALTEAILNASGLDPHMCVQRVECMRQVEEVIGPDKIGPRQQQK